ncbi:hypothetical protein Bca52824_070707 [Brassica carinata]|uniref:Uncharacterized protein n=1 Tax=Brassica carinata TaxID=52824 RepID=A0A8X7Q8Q7_BRACI|nr:hypothetical protein Bca52824_070707 [Brassica carinata]
MSLLRLFETVSDDRVVKVNETGTRLKYKPWFTIARFVIRTEILSEEVTWGRVSMVDAEKRLLVSALEDPDNQHFVLLSESCILLTTPIDILVFLCP